MEHDQRQHVEHAPSLLTPDAVAARLSVSRNMVYDLLRRGELPKVYVGRLPRVTEEDLRAFITKARARRS
jgi:excisionase family DNA binding protein